MRLSIIALAAIATALAATAADAKPRKHRAVKAQPIVQCVSADDRYVCPVQSAARPIKGNKRQAQNPGPGFGGSSLVSSARAYLGTNPTGKAKLWCARFMNMVLERNGRRGTGSDMASSFASYGTRVSGPQVGAIAVMSRGKRGGHVGIVSGIDEAGNPIIISGNHGGRVGESVYPRGRIYAYVMP
jgi:uncharacterized protein (TIGR02594 family)